MEAAVNEKEVTNPKRRLIVKLSGEAREAPTITAKPIIKQLNGLINRRNPISFPNFFNSAWRRIQTFNEYIAVWRPIMTVKLLGLSLV